MLKRPTFSALKFPNQANKQSFFFKLKLCFFLSCTSKKTKNEEKQTSFFEALPKFFSFGS